MLTLILSSLHNISDSVSSISWRSIRWRIQSFEVSDNSKSFNLSFPSFSWFNLYKYSFPDLNHLQGDCLSSYGKAHWKVGFPQLSTSIIWVRCYSFLSNLLCLSALNFLCFLMWFFLLVLNLSFNFPTIETDFWGVLLSRGISCSKLGDVSLQILEIKQ